MREKETEKGKNIHNFSQGLCFLEPLTKQRQARVEGTVALNLNQCFFKPSMEGVLARGRGDIPQRRQHSLTLAFLLFCLRNLLPLCSSCYLPHHRQQ